MKILITGGAGYIGSHCVKMLKDKAEIVVVDNFSTGHKSALDKDIKYYEADIRDIHQMDKIFKDEKVDAVIHFAAKSLVKESCEKPFEYFENNVYGTLELLKAMVSNNVKKIVFSSSAAVYGEVESPVITEDLPLNPSSPYGETKVMMEEIMKWFDKAYGVKYVSLRYFNVAGAYSDASIGEDHHPETHLIPIVLSCVLGKKESLDVYGDDYPTRDGSCIRDYVNVEDLIDGHIKALDYLFKGGESDIFNLGTKTGSSVFDIIHAAEEVSNKKINYSVKERRSGDPASLVASIEKAQKVLGFENKHSLKDSISSALEFHAKHPEGFPK